MRAYDEIYLDDAMQNLGELVDYTVNRCGEDPDQVMRDFINSGMAEKFGHGVPAVVSGRSGIELAYEMFQLVNRQLREHAAADSPDPADCRSAAARSSVCHPAVGLGRHHFVVGSRSSPVP